MLTEKAQQIGKLWGVEAQDWLDIQEKKSPALWNPVLDLAQVSPGTTILDAGCGTGGAAVLAQRRGAIVSGCDASEEMLAIARSRLPEADLRVAELENLPYPDRSFDVVLAINSLQFAPDPAKAADELARVAKHRVAVVVWAVEHCEQKAIFDAILALFEKPPRGRGVFALSEPGQLEALFPNSTTHEIDCAFEYPSLDIALRGQMAAGPSQRVVEIFGKEKVETAVREALKRFVQPGGSVKMQNRFRCLIATR
ncbi:MAG: class I SAM-dependent methyltransferase [Acidobacteriia bacterium]|nr:class I SAM-dependent methyltransferase [Terriglobia bacterium]